MSGSEWIKLPTIKSPLRRYAIRERVGVKIVVITQARPLAVLLRCVCDTVFLTLREVVPRIVAGYGEEGPIGAFQVLHQYISDSRIAWCAWQFAKHFFQLLPMTGSRAIIRDRINRARRLGFRIGIDAHCARELLP